MVIQGRCYVLFRPRVKTIRGSTDSIVGVFNAYDGPVNYLAKNNPRADIGVDRRKEPGKPEVRIVTLSDEEGFELFFVYTAPVADTKTYSKGRTDGTLLRDRQGTR